MTKGFLLAGEVVVNPDIAVVSDVRIQGDRILEVAPGLKPRKGEVVIDCTDRYLYPGLINAHDHLSFNMFPRLGDPPYPNSYEWGTQIRLKYRATIERILRIPLHHRLYWGAWKNLFSGIETVVHHDPYFVYFRMAYPLNVLKRYTYAHSLGFETDFPKALRNRRDRTPFILHLAEGTDERASAEVDRLEKLGGLDERTVAVHAVGIQSGDVKILEGAKSSVVWCPASNYFLFGKTAPVKTLQGKVRVAIGTDSTITGSTSLFDELRCARQGASLSPRELFGMVTDAPRRIFGLTSDAGRIIRNGRATLFLMDSQGVSPYARLLRAQPGDIEAFWRRGRIMFAAQEFLPPGGQRNRTGCTVALNGRAKWIASRQFTRLFRRYKSALGHYAYLHGDLR